MIALTFDIDHAVDEVMITILVKLHFVPVVLKVFFFAPYIIYFFFARFGNYIVRWVKN